MSGSLIVFNRSNLPLITLLASTHKQVNDFVIKHCHHERAQSFTGWPTIESSFTTGLSCLSVYAEIENSPLFSIFSNAQIPYSVHENQMDLFVTPTSCDKPPVFLWQTEQGAVINKFEKHRNKPSAYWVDKILEIALLKERERNLACEFIKDVDSFYRKSHSNSTVCKLIYDYLTGVDGLKSEMVSEMLTVHTADTQKNIELFLMGYSEAFKDNGEAADIKRRLDKLINVLQEKNSANIDHVTDNSEPEISFTNNRQMTA